MGDVNENPTPQKAKRTMTQVAALGFAAMLVAYGVKRVVGSRAEVRAAKAIKIGDLEVRGLLQLQALDRINDKIARTRSKNKKTLVGIFATLALFSHVLQIRAANGEIFSFFDKGTPAGCALSAWRIVMPLAHPWVSQMFFTEPLSRNSAFVVRMMIQEGNIPGPNYLCGSLCAMAGGGRDPLACVSDLTTWLSSEAAWDNQTGGMVNPMGRGYMGIPYNSPIVTDFSKTPEPLRYLYIHGLPAFLESRGANYAPLDTYNYMYGYVPKPPCHKPSVMEIAMQVLNPMATGSMVGAAGGPEGAALGAFFGIIIGGLTAWDSVANTRDC